MGYLKSLVPPGLPMWLRPIMFVLEFLTYFLIRPLTLALRLFGNMLAGHLMLLVFILGGEYLLLHGSNLFVQFSGVLGLGFGIVMTFFELLVQFLQAFIFTPARRPLHLRCGERAPLMSSPQGSLHGH
jgi:F-type H+-transporting ATPase subunit a